jgi:NADH-quinone oxidoreductase subunit A
MLFVIFDIEIVFLYPWAVASGRLGLFGLVAVLIFSAMLFESFVYLISKGALDWGPLQVNRRQVAAPVPLRSADRTSESTIRRVGLEGRYEQVSSLRSDHELLRNSATGTAPEHELEVVGSNSAGGS